MQGSVSGRGTVRAGAAWLGWLLAGIGAAAAGCSGEAEVTTEIEEAAPGSGAELGSMPAPAAEEGDLSLGPEQDGTEPAPGESEAGPTPIGRSPDGRGGTGNSGGVPAPNGTAPMSVAAEVPDGEHCDAVNDWDPEWVQFEEEVLLLVNERRSEAADCGVEGTFGAAVPLVMDPILRCSARLHSLDMFERDFFDHTNPDGVDPFERMDEAGFRGSGAGENIAVGQISPEQVMLSWMDSDGHCANVMRGNYTLLGVGYHPGAGGRGLGSNFWTQNFGAPASVRGGRCRGGACR